MNPNKVSVYFDWRDALFLPQFNRLATEADGVTTEVKANLIVLFSKLDKIREHFNKPIIIHVAYRSPEYNALVKGAPNSAHMKGQAADFHVAGVSCDNVRQDILDNKLLDNLLMRMEDLPCSSWVHLGIDQPLPGHSRFFKP